MTHAAKNPSPPVPYTDHAPGSPFLLEGDEATGHCRILFDSTNGPGDTGHRELILSGTRADLLPILRTLRYLWTLRP